MYGVGATGASDATPLRQPSLAASQKLPNLSDIQPRQTSSLQQEKSTAGEAAAAAAAVAAVGPHTLASCAPLRSLLAENMRAALPRGPLTAAARQAKDMFWALALCNNVVPQTSEDGSSIKYQVHTSGAGSAHHPCQGSERKVSVCN